MIKIEDLSFSYKGKDKQALKNINLEIENGEFVGIIGPSGAGKSTLTYVINGIIPHHYKGEYYGKCTVDGKDTFDEKLTDISLSVGSVFQDTDSQMITSMVEDEIMYGLENYAIPKDEIESRIREALENVGITHLRHRKISTLSGGQKQKVAIAAIIAIKPKILILDEPTGELDPKSTKQIFDLLKRLSKEENMTIVVVEQKIMLLSEYCDKLLILKDGVIEYFDKTRNVLEHSDELLKIGVNCPRVSTLSMKLKENGYQIEKPAINVNEAVEMVHHIINC